jgi:hypothetical protein
MISAQIEALDKLAQHDTDGQCRVYSEMTDLVNVCNNFFDSSPKDIAKIKIDFDRVVRP